MRQKGAIKVRLGVWFEMAEFFVTLCITINYDFLDQFGTEFAL